MKKLLVASDLFPAVISGKKRITIRPGYRDFNPGDIIRIENTEDSDQYVERTVFEVLKFIQACRIPNRYIKEDGFNSTVEMELVLQRFYPDFNEISPVTIIYWSL